MAITTLSAHQEAIMTAIRTDRQNLEIEAAAGSGKTSTLEWAIRHVIPKSETTLYVVFNKKNEMEAKERLEDTGAATMTLNALGFRAMGAGSKKRYELWHGMQGKPAKCWEIVRAILGDAKSRENKIYGKTVKHLLDLARSEGIGAKVYNPRTGKVELLPIESDDAWTALIERYEVDTESGEQNTYDAIAHSKKALSLSIEWAVERKIIDFADQNYMPATGLVPLKWPEADNVLVDEAQDLNAVQVECVARIVAARKARLVFVGDPWQAIYGFRGALNESMAALAKRFACKKLPLSVCWRCDASMIELAQSTGAPIQVAPGKAQGRTETLSSYNTVAGDIVLCRTTAPLISAAYKLIAQGRPAIVLGRDIGAGLIALIKKLRAKSVNELSQKLGQWVRDEIAQAEEEGKFGKAGAAEDKAQCLEVIIDNLSGADRTIKGLESEIKRLFSKDAIDSAVTFSTIHKAKGLEWDRVIILDREKMPLKWAKAPWQQKQEVHCMYVAYTRARHELFFVSSANLDTVGSAADAQSGDMQLM